MMRYRSMLLALALAGPAAAQPATVVVPAGAEVVIPARGAAPIAAALPEPRRARRALGDRLALPAPASSEPSPLLIGVPLTAAAALLAASLAGGGGGGGGVSAPTRTR